MPSRSSRAWPRCFLMLLLSLSLAACGPRGAAESSGESAAAEPDSVAQDALADEQDPAVPVEIAVLEQGPIESVVSATATLEAEQQVIVYAEAARRVQEIRVEEGDKVQRAQLLLRLQDEEQRSALARARTLLEQAEREYERQERLFERQLTTEKSRNDALSELEQRRLGVSDAERELGYTEVRAPISGTITRRFVKLADQVNPGQQLFELIDFDSIVALIYVPEKDLQSIQEDQPVRVFAPAITSDPYPASVLRISPIVDARTGTVKVTVAVGGLPGLRPGLYVDVEVITTVRDDALLIPKRAVIHDNDRMFVFRVGPESRVERVLVLPAMSDRDHVVPLEGLAVGDSVITAGQAGLKDGARVEIVERSPASNATESTP